MRYKVGDKVKIRADLNPNDEYGGLIPVQSMCEERGNVATIKNSEVRDGLLLYCIEGDMCNFLWTGEMFEGVVNEAPSVTKRINDKHNILNGLLQTDGSVDGEKLMKKLEENQVQVANGVVMNDRPQRPTGSASTPASTEQFKDGDKLQFVKDYNFPRGGSVLKGSIWEIAEVNIEIYTLLYVGGENSISGKCGYNINLPLEVLTSHCVRIFGEVFDEAKTKGSHYEKAAMQPLEIAQRMFTKEQFKAILAFQVMKYRLRKDYKGQKESDEYKALQYCYWLELVNKDIMINPSKDKVPEGYEYKGVIM